MWLWGCGQTSKRSPKSMWVIMGTTWGFTNGHMDPLNLLVFSLLSKFLDFGYTSSPSYITVTCNLLASITINTPSFLNSIYLPIQLCSTKIWNPQLASSSLHQLKKLPEARETQWLFSQPSSNVSCPPHCRRSLMMPSKQTLQRNPKTNQNHRELRL